MDLNIIDKDYSVVEKSVFFAKYTKEITGFRLFENDTTQYFSNKEKGIVFIFNNEVLTSIHFYGQGNKDYQVFKDDLPFGISFSDNMSEVYQKFGALEIKKGGGDMLPILGKSNYWSMFLIEGNCFRFEFKNDEIILITLSNAYKKNA